MAKISTDPNTGEDVLEITSQRVLDKTGDMDPADAAELITDLQSNPKLLVEMNKNPELVDAWEVLNNAGVSQVAKSDVNNIANYSEYLEKSEAFTQQESAISVFDKTDGTHYAHNSPSNPEFDIDASQELTFSYKYKTGPNANSKDVYGKVGLTDDGYLVANIRKTTGMENMNVTGVTEDAMDMALKEFGGIENVNGVKALWVENATLYPNTPGNKSTNLLLFEDALQSLPPDQAIFQTITGGYAKNRVFSKVISIRKLTESVDGVNGYEVIFGK